MAPQTIEIPQLGMPPVRITTGNPNHLDLVRQTINTGIGPDYSPHGVVSFKNMTPDAALGKLEARVPEAMLYNQFDLLYLMHLGRRALSQILQSPVTQLIMNKEQCQAVFGMDHLPNMRLTSRDPQVAAANYPTRRRVSLDLANQEGVTVDQTFGTRLGHGVYTAVVFGADPKGLSIAYTETGLTETRRRMPEQMAQADGIMHTAQFMGALFAAVRGGQLNSLDQAFNYTATMTSFF